MVLEGLINSFARVVSETSFDFYCQPNHRRAGSTFQDCFEIADLSRSKKTFSPPDLKERRT